VTAVPVGSRTTVPGQTQEGLTSGFGMRPGKHLRCDRAPNFLRIGIWWLRHRLWEVSLLDRGCTLVACGYKMKKMLERLVPRDWTRRRTFVLTSAVYQTRLLRVFWDASSLGRLRA